MRKDHPSKRPEQNKTIFGFDTGKQEDLTLFLKLKQGTRDRQGDMTAAEFVSQRTQVAEN